MKRNTTIYNWAVISDPYQAPEIAPLHLEGKLACGKNIRTSPIVGKIGDQILTKSGSKYSIEDVDPEYGKLFPEAKQRLLDSLTEK